MKKIIPFFLSLLLIVLCITVFQVQSNPNLVKVSEPGLPDTSSLNTYPASLFSIVIDKSDYEMHVYDEEGWLATYPIVFGSKDLSDKMREGDKRTPDGTFTVILKKHHPKWGPELLLDYPTAESRQRFEQRKKQGLIPKGARIGGGIAIHGTRPEEEWTVDNFYNWTDGCISVRYSEMLEIYDLIPVGTKVTIQP
ncbi:MAG TPA: L,D-transpeptidase [Ferruginibacter sp.]|nr:L,D-transpeptidase [Ferruginibacter sp.]HRO06515.1 L,D-transpeptidase [Ferruginibacter sp.]HRO95460.1 L,D-transpeptidase [Ferruginibacter sp.]HRP49954.1 L,D-transpeptidase [Ferruginibacter sp.]